MKKLISLTLLIITIVSIYGIEKPFEVENHYSGYKELLNRDNEIKWASDSLNVKGIGRVPYYFGYARDVSVVDTLAYVCMGYSLVILNISDETNPILISDIWILGDAWGVYVSDSFAYVTATTAGLRIIDISDPTTPTEIGYHDTPGYAYDVYVSGNYAYVADYDAGLRIIDISDPTTPTEVGYYDTPGNARGVYVLGSYAYIADE
ncbi:MAG: hypothetical protein R6U31_06630, partial [bacterium]